MLDSQIHRLQNNDGNNYKYNGICKKTQKKFSKKFNILITLIKVINDLHIHKKYITFMF